LRSRPIDEADVERILAIQAACPEIAQWTRWDYDRVARGEMAGWVAEEQESVAGFIVARQIAKEIEILNFAVSPEMRGRGIGAMLLRETLAWAKTFEGTHAILEVRASNAAALRFYERHNFQVAGRRSRYYAFPTEDALLLTAKIP
jgi:[ribosomal protein S18]-alanine N-acetyltransferase